MSRTALCALVALGLAAPLFAHHGTSGTYDEKGVFILKGTVKDFRWRNPHSALFIEGKDATGKIVTYALEMGGPNGLVKAGYTRQTFKPGDQVEMETHQSFTNPLNLHVRYSDKVVVNGQTLATTADN